jgi:glucose-1-phosphate adenylyltransferase
MGADYYEEEARNMGQNAIPMGVGRGSRLSGAIIDKNARIGEGVRIEPFPLGTEIDEENWSVRDGIVVVPKSATLPSGMVIAP